MRVMESLPAFRGQVKHLGAFLATRLAKRFKSEALKYQNFLEVV